MARNPFGDYSTVDLSSIYQNLPGATGTPAPGTGTPGTGGTPGAGAPGTVTQPASYQPSVTYDPNANGGTGNLDQYNQSLATGLLNGSFTPEQQAAQARGQNPANAAGPDDGSPERALPGNAYAGIYLNETGSLSPDQQASIQYATPAFQTWLQQQVQLGPGQGADLDFTRKYLEEAYQYGGYAGSSSDLMAAIQMARNAEYAQYVYQAQKSGATPVSQADFESGQGYQQIDPNAAPGTAPATGTVARDNMGHATGGVPISSSAPGYQSFLPGATGNGATGATGASGGAGGSSAGGSASGGTASPDYAALAATDLKYAAALYHTNPQKAQMYVDRASEYMARAYQAQQAGANGNTQAAPAVSNSPAAPAGVVTSGKNASPLPAAPAATGAATYGAAGSVTPPAAGSTQPAGSAITQPAPSAGTPAAAPAQNNASLQAAIAQDNKYISNLQAVKNPTQAQKDELATYQGRVADYSSRISQPSSSAGTVAQGSASATI